MELIKIREEILEIIDKRQKELHLTFEEEAHKYTMMDSKGKLRSDFPSVSKVIKEFYKEFDAEEKSLKKAKGDPAAQKILLAEWAASGDYATNMGSRAHYNLEIESLKLFGINKTVRQPIFVCDDEQIETSDNMIAAGIKFLNLMKDRGALLLDTETVLGSAELEYTGQPDKIWLIKGKDAVVGFCITDYKTNKPKNFEVQWYTEKMYPPFEYLDSTDLGHYYLQLPFYAKLFLNMMKGSKYENIKFLGAVIVLLKKDASFEEFRIPQKVITTILEMDMKKYLNQTI